MRKSMYRILSGAALAFGCMQGGFIEAWVNSPCYSQEWNIFSDVQISTGYREDSLRWSIADVDGTPDTLAEMKWRDIQIWELKGQTQLKLFNLLYGRASASYGWIFHGSSGNTIYAGDGRTLEVASSSARSNQGEVFDFCGGIGWQLDLCLCDNILRLYPLIGYSYSEQHLRDHHGEILVNTAFSTFGSEIPLGPLGPVEGLHSNYRAKWYGGWIGVDAAMQVSCNTELFGTFEYHRLKFHGTGHWNLRTDFVQDFEQKSTKGYGFYGAGGLKHTLCSHIFVGLTGSYTYMNSRHGRDTIYLAAGSQSTRLNKAVWQSWSIVADVGMRF